MNKLVKVFAVAVMLVMGGQAMAQTRGAMFLGASLPMKSFSEFNGFNEFALTSSDAFAQDGGANIGFNAGLKWYFNVGVKGLGVMLSVDGLYNGPCTDLKNAYRNQEGESGGQLLGGSFHYRAKPQYINVPAMLGMNYIYHFNPNLGMFIEGGAGCNFGFITSMESVSKATILGVETQTINIQEYDMACSFAYQAGIGIEVAKRLVIGCSFYDLGTAYVKGDFTKKEITLNDNVTNTTHSYRELGSIHPIMVLGRIGFSF